MNTPDNAPKGAKVTKAEYTALKSTEKRTKDGKSTIKESGYYFRARVAGVWYNANTAVLNGKITREAGAAFMGTFNRDAVAALLPDWLSLFGCEVSEAVKTSAREAIKRIDERNAKREKRERETVAKGRGAFIEKAKESAGARFDRLVDKYAEAPEAEETDGEHFEHIGGVVC